MRAGLLPLHPLLSGGPWSRCSEPPRRPLQLVRERGWGGGEQDCSAVFLTVRVDVLGTDHSAVHRACAGPAHILPLVHLTGAELRSRKFCSSSETSKEQKSPVTWSLAPTTAEPSGHRGTAGLVWFLLEKL